ncbi:sirohydrochlorin chelatase [Micromonospora sp. NPDC050397]|uniref:sirohydrochlorin chelatase n=1 Tax=Micromonospora sp. NPDC050397 TaxID=3364279 RepID=UPI00384D7D42
MRPARMNAGPGPVVLVAHGSRDPRAAAETRALVRAVELARPGLPVRASYLDHAGPRPGQVLHDLAAAGHPYATVVPLLLTAAYHGRVDIPGAIATARAEGLQMPVRVTDVLGPATVSDPPDELLLTALCRRLTESGAFAGSDVFAGSDGLAGPCAFAGSGAVGGFDRHAAVRVDAVVLAAAGTRDADARRGVEGVAGALRELLGVPCVAAYASAAPPTAGAVVERLRAAGARRIAVAAYFLAPGRLYGASVASARAAGAATVAEPLTDAPELARLVLRRADAPIPARV